MARVRSIAGNRARARAVARVRSIAGNRARAVAVARVGLGQWLGLGV